MKKLIVCLFLLTGCCLNEQYVKADRATYDALKGPLETGIAAEQDSVLRESYKLVQKTWEKRLKEGENYVGN